MYEDENSNKDAEKDEQENNSPTVPFILSSTPLKCEKKADDGWNEDCGSVEVKFLDAGFPSEIRNRLTIWRLEEEKDDNHGYSSDRQVNVETPTPCS